MLLEQTTELELYYSKCMYVISIVISSHQNPLVYQTDIEMVPLTSAVPVPYGSTSKPLEVLYMLIICTQFVPRNTKTTIDISA